MMGYDCRCGTSVGTRAHWCEWMQELHARRVERLLELLVRNTTPHGYIDRSAGGRRMEPMTDDTERWARAMIDRYAPGYDDHGLPE